MDDADITIRFNDLLKVSSDVLGIPAEGVKALTSRLKHLQGKGFPRGVNVGRNARVGYDTEAIVSVVIVLALISVFMPPNAATALVREQWSDWATLVADSSAGLKRLDGSPDASRPTFAVIETNALSELGTAKAVEGRAAGSRGLRSMRPATAAQLGRETKRTGGVFGAATVVDVASLVDRICEHLIADGHATAPALAQAFAALPAKSSISKA